jgi:arginine utilization regulatory protein
MRSAIRMARMSAASPSPIMISGETGTGKELFAQSIHNHSPRKKKPFIPVNCAAIPENLLEGILFGTSRGSFTGAIDKPGLFEQANGGTIFLDELDAMPLTLQVKLLRVIQEKKVRKLGSLKEIDLDVKILSSVGQQPLKIVQNGSLRMDLFYRMGVVSIMLPPLRERQEDMETLIQHFIAKYNQALGEKVESISSEVADLFVGYRWPGNVRELENVIERAALLSENGIIKVEQLPVDLKEKNRDFLDENQISLSEFPTLALDEIEIIMLKKTLDESSSLTEAARILGVSRSTFYRKLKKYNIDR